MREFFRGWRRKVGCVLLVFAVMIAGLWLRSHLQTDAVYSFGARANVLSKWPFLIFVWHAPGNGKERLLEWASRDVATDQYPDPFERDDLEWRIETAGVQAGEYLIGGDPVIVVAIPHQLIAIPLALLSALLILFPQRRTPRQTAIESDQAA